MQTKMLINGEMVAGGGEALPVLDPSTGETVAQVAEDAATVSGLAKDITEFMVVHGLNDASAPALTVGYHAACSLQHGQKVTAAPKTLLKQAGFGIVEPKDPHLCCGSAGTYSILQPEASRRLQTRKLEALTEDKPSLIATANVGCQLHLGEAADIPVRHWIELIDEAL